MALFRSSSIQVKMLKMGDVFVRGIKILLEKFKGGGEGEWFVVYNTFDGMFTNFE